MSNDQKNSNHFWSGFSVGMIAGGAILWGVATKKGRETVKKVLNNTESLENNLEDILIMLQKSNLLGKEEVVEEKKKK